MLNLNVLTPVAYIPDRYARILDIDTLFGPLSLTVPLIQKLLENLHGQFFLSSVVRDYLKESNKNLPDAPANHEIYILKDIRGRYYGVLNHNGDLYIGTVTYTQKTGGHAVWCGQFLSDMQPF